MRTEQTLRTLHASGRVFAAIDFSRASDRALRQAHERAALTGAKLAVCHIDEAAGSVASSGMQEETHMMVNAEMHRISDAIVDRVAAVTGRSVDEVTVFAGCGTPHVEILKAAEVWGADLIAIGSRGIRSAGCARLGRVTRHIIRYAPAPVLIARSGNPAGRILAGTDFSDPAMSAIETALEEARTADRPLTVLHSVDVVHAAAARASEGGGAPPAISDAGYAALKESGSNRLREALARLGAQAETLVVSGPPGPALVQTAETLEAGMLVVGAVGRTGLGRIWLGSVAENVAREAPCSVMITRMNQQDASPDNS